MDITLMRTFLEVAASGSFVQSADKLFVTQSAVSLRIKRLEEQLGHALFTRSKAGAELTAEGEAFSGYALSLVKIWEEARQQIGIPDGFDRAISIGAEQSLWSRFGFRWIDAMEARMPDLSIRAEFGQPDRLTRFLVEGVIQASLTYLPQVRPNLRVEKLFEEDLVLVAGWPDPDLGRMDGRYVMIDWGPEFVQAHAIGLPELKSGKTLALGALATRFVVNRGLAAYLPARAVAPLIDAGRLHLVPDAPIFPYPVWLVWREDMDEAVRDGARKALADVVGAAVEAQEAVLEDLEDASEESVGTLGASHED
ncbi:LysR family transcriptional regulator [Jannaschia sp. W003]|uniref:LysR family transcriptional regulator n=1 Tax=Jannaschia sp. W003 TaxID=2867012 RepID=UPI0021A375F6|nr:LysR family transcriptional regulator [Jannaschia sp. W003]UWQ23140.1 LysR family transcriptional regulator [Jannaschia sp. W003]